MIIILSLPHAPIVIMYKDEWINKVHGSLVKPNEHRRHTYAHTMRRFLIAQSQASERANASCSPLASFIHSNVTPITTIINMKMMIKTRRRSGCGCEWMCMREVTCIVMGGGGELRRSREKESFISFSSSRSHIIEREGKRGFPLSFQFLIIIIIDRTCDDDDAMMKWGMNGVRKKKKDYRRRRESGNKCFVNTHKEQWRERRKPRKKRMRLK